MQNATSQFEEGNYSPLGYAVVDADSGQVYVDPKTDCPHIGQHVHTKLKSVKKAYQSNSCSGCGDKRENWVCLECGATNCSRYVKSHAAAHYEQTNHAISLSFSDLSVWCYLCDWYITHEDLKKHIASLYVAKFNQPHPRVATEDELEDENHGTPAANVSSSSSSSSSSASASASAPTPAPPSSSSSSSEGSK